MDMGTDMDTDIMTKTSSTGKASGASSHAESKSSSSLVKTWTLVIRPQSSLLDLQLKGVWQYRDLLVLFVRRDFVTFYKQTVLGPLWFFIQPILTTIIFTFIFGRVANISTGGIPHVLFYLSGIVLWNYFAECVNKTSGTFIQNASIFGKVYFPRLIVPLSVVISNIIRFGVQFLLFVFIWLYYMFVSDVHIEVTWAIALLPLQLLVMAILGLGIGLIISSLTVKYRDLTFLITFAIQLAMYASPVVYQLETLPKRYRWIVAANPMSGIIESFRFGFLGQGSFNIELFIYSICIAGLFLVVGLIMFNRIQRSFMDTV